MERQTYRVVQWATGTVGRSALRAVIRHPRLELVGVHVHSPEKEGRDAGELSGLTQTTGVKATRDIEAILALKPDCVLYMQEGAQFDDICRLLAHGINIVTTRGEFFNGGMMKPELRDRVEAACRRGGASLHATGSSPGFITEVIPFALTSIQRRLDCFTIDEFANILHGCSPDMIFNVMGFGETPEAFAKREVAERDECFGFSLNAVATALGLPLDDVTVGVETAASRVRIPVGDGAIEPGTVGAQRITIAGLRNGKPLLRFRSNWYCTKELDPAWTLQDTGWHVIVEGDAPLDVTIQIPIPVENPLDALAGLTAHRPVNAIPYVCRAKPGILTTSDLPLVIADLGA